MPSIPQSLLWISLVILWLFVLVPMLISKRDAVRRTSDVALATRVLNNGRERLLRRSAPAAGHASDPNWQPRDDFDDDLDDDLDDDEDEARDAEDSEERTDELQLDFDEPTPDEPAVDEPKPDEPAVAEADEPEEPKAEEPAVAEAVVVEAVAEAPEVQHDAEEETDAPDDEYEYVADSSGLEAPSEADLQLAESLSAARRRRYESKTAAAVSIRKYKFRRRMVTCLVALTAVTAAAAYTLAPTLWWVCGGFGAVTVLYLAYLRRQTRIEERLRRRRAQRIARARLGVLNTDDDEFDLVPARLRRPGSVVLEIDDEDPIFEHLDYAPFARHFDLPHAAGQ